MSLVSRWDQKFVHGAEEGDDEEIARIIAEINGAYPLQFMRDKVTCWR